MSHLSLEERNEIHISQPHLITSKEENETYKPQYPDIAY